jgi:hypothetical protein
MKKEDNALGSMLFRVLAGFGALPDLRTNNPEVYEHVARCQKAAEADAETHAMLVAELGPDYLVH